MMELYAEVACDFILPPCEITMPTGIEGHYTTYKNGDDCYEECTLDLGGDTRLNFWFLYKKSNPCDISLYNQVKEDLLEHIRKV